MTTGIEMKEDLVEFPELLPPEDQMLPSTLFDLDQAIEKAKAELKRLTAEREDIVARILQNGITEDAYCTIGTKARAMRKLIPEQYRIHFPTAYERACDIVRAELEEKKKNPGPLIGVQLAERLAGGAKDLFAKCVEVKDYTAYIAIPKNPVIVSEEEEP